jgi:hypothetical protein
MFLLSPKEKSNGVRPWSAMENCARLGQFRNSVPNHVDVTQDDGTTGQVLGGAGEKRIVQLT